MRNIVNSLTSNKISVRACDLQTSTVLPVSSFLLFLDQGPHAGRAAEQALGVILVQHSLALRHQCVQAPQLLTTLTDLGTTNMHQCISTLL